MSQTDLESAVMRFNNAMKDLRATSKRVISSRRTLVDERGAAIESLDAAIEELRDVLGDGAAGEQTGRIAPAQEP